MSGHHNPYFEDKCHMKLSWKGITVLDKMAYRDEERSDSDADFSEPGFPVR